MLKYPINIFVLFVFFYGVNSYAEYIQPEYQLQMKLNKSSAFLGETLYLYLELHYKELEDYTVVKPIIEGMKVEEISDEEHKIKDGVWLDTITYKITPQKSGIFKIVPQSAEIEFLSKGYKNLNNRYKYLQKRMIESNSFELNINALPIGISIIGDYKLKAEVDTKTLKAGEPLNYTVKIEGRGNLQSLNNLNLDISDVTIYENASLNQKNIIEKSFKIVANKSFIIPPLSLKYFNIKSSKIDYLLTKSFEIIVDGIALRKKKKGLSMLEKSSYFGGGVLSVLLFLFIIKFILLIKQKKEDSQVIRNLKKIKEKEIFLKKVVPYLSRDKRLDYLIYKLETVAPTEFKKLKTEILLLVAKNCNVV